MSQSDELRNIALKLALADTGQQETPRGSNWGGKVTEYLKSVWITFPAPWCMAFVFYQFQQAAKQLKIPNPVFRTGGVLACWNASTPFRRAIPQPGDVFIMDFGKGKGHTGIVVKVTGNSIETIEGNTNDDGSREGYEVARRVRTIASCKGFLRF